MFAYPGSRRVDQDDQHDPLARPSWACVLCPPPRGHAWTQADAKYVTCSPCSTRMRERISEVAERYLKLDPRPGAYAESGGRRPPGFGSRPPANLGVISVRDPRSSADSRVWLGRDGRIHREDERPPRSVHSVLSTVCWSVAESRDIPGPSDRDDVYALLRYLDALVDHHITRDVDLTIEVDAELRDLVAMLRPMTGDRRVGIGKCPMMVERENGRERCAVKIPSPGGLSGVVKCPGCGHSWALDQWLTLADESDLEPAQGDSAQ